MTKIFALLIVALFLVGCESPATSSQIYIVSMIGDCTESTGGWGGMTGMCRVEFEDGSRATVFRPVNLGDSVECRGVERGTWNCRVK